MTKLVRFQSSRIKLAALIGWWYRRSMKKLCSRCGSEGPFDSGSPSYCQTCRREHDRNTRARNRKIANRICGTVCSRCGSISVEKFWRPNDDHALVFRDVSRAKVSRVRSMLKGRTSLCRRCFNERHLQPKDGQLHVVEGRKTYVHHSGYVAAYHPTHPQAWPNGYVFLHRLVAENFMGRYLDEDELIHHIDENPFNNDPGNLEVVTDEEHKAAHRKPDVVAVCPGCGDEFSHRPTKRRRKYCGRSCANRYAQRAAKQTVHASRKRPSKKKIARLVWKYTTSRIAQHYGVSDTAVAKWCKKYGIDKPPRGYWQKKRAGKL